jgi:hypothetical protein
MLNFFLKNKNFKSKNIVKNNTEYLGIFYLSKWFFSKLINYLMNMCWNGRGTMVIELLCLIGLLGFWAWHALNFQKVWQIQKVIKLYLTSLGTRVIPEMGWNEGALETLVFFLGLNWTKSTCGKIVLSPIFHPLNRWWSWIIVFNLTNINMWENWFKNKNDQLFSNT